MSVLNVDQAATFHTVLNIIDDCAQDWQLGISVSKCSIVNIGRNVLELITISVIVYCPLPICHILSRPWCPTLK